MSTFAASFKGKWHFTDVIKVISLDIVTWFWKKFGKGEGPNPITCVSRRRDYFLSDSEV